MRGNLGDFLFGGVAWWINLQRGGIEGEPNVDAREGIQEDHDRSYRVLMQSFLLWVLVLLNV